MGQYFKFVNVDRKEYVAPPGPMKAIERVTQPISMGMLGFLLLEGPQDGTAFSRRANGVESGEREQAIEEMKAQEREMEERTDRESVYRADDGGWDRAMLERIVASGLSIDEANEYAGRWAGDDVRVVGDYADNDYYDAARPVTTVEYEGEEHEIRRSITSVVIEIGGPDDDFTHTERRKDPEPGDTVRARLPDENDVYRDVYAEFVKEEDSEWVDITEGLAAEFEAFVGQDWIEDQSGGLMRPDMLFSV